MENNSMNMMSGESGPERIYGFSDGVFAILITIMVLELKKPAAASFKALFELWPVWLSYFISYIFIAIVWINHHFLMKFAGSARIRLMWANFAHLFCVSLIPFLTEWMADTRLMPVPVVLYAFDFFLVNVTYLWLIWETICVDMARDVPNRARYLLHFRSFVTMGIFIVAAILAFWLPYISVGLIVACLILYTSPEVPKMAMMQMPKQGHTAAMKKKSKGI